MFNITVFKYSSLSVPYETSSKSKLFGGNTESTYFIDNHLSIYCILITIRQYKQKILKKKMFHNSGKEIKN